MTEQQTNEADERKPTRTRRPSSEAKQEVSSERKRTTSSSEKTQATKRPQRSSSETKQQRPAKPKLSARKAAVAALEQLQLLTTRTPESVTGVTPHEDGWRVTVEVVESARIPDTADIMAEYDVDIDGSGELAGYTRGARYFRGRTREE